jgi:hypothetical protein
MHVACSSHLCWHVLIAVVNVSKGLLNKAADVMLVCGLHRLIQTSTYPSDIIDDCCETECARGIWSSSSGPAATAAACAACVHTLHSLLQPSSSGAPLCSNMCLHSPQNMHTLASPGLRIHCC